MEKFPIEAEGVQEENGFRDQFKKREKIEVVGGTADVVDVSPETAKTEVPVFLAPAWACSTDVYEPAIKTLYDKGRRVVSLDHPRRGGDFDTVVSQEDLKKFPPEQLRKAANILGVLEEKGIKKTDIIAHSEGAINAVIAATIEPEKFRNLVLFAPAGLIGKDSFLRLLKGFTGQSDFHESMKGRSPSDERFSWPEIPVSEEMKKRAPIFVEGAKKYLIQNPIRSLKETIDISKSQIHEMLRDLHAKGIGIVVISGIDDPVFPMEKMQKIANTDFLDGFLSVRGGHGEIGNHPERYMVAAEQMLTALEEKQKKNK
jgi:pimeloyl-ACP methyl ester carboxylesterase